MVSSEGVNKITCEFFQDGTSMLDLIKGSRNDRKTWSIQHLLLPSTASLLLMQMSLD